MRIVSVITALCVMFPFAVAHADVNTGLLEREAGFVGDEIGTRVLEVDRSTDGVTVLDLSLPPLGEDVDSVDVLDKEGRPIEQLRPAEIDGNDNKRLGVRLYLKRAPKVDFRLRLYDDADQ